MSASGLYSLCAWLTVAVAGSFSYDNALRCVLPVLTCYIDVMFVNNGRGKGDTNRAYTDSDSRGGSTGSEV